ncbi:MAG: M14 family zinc carboxypeptidase [Sulfolobales archaeon]
MTKIPEPREFFGFEIGDDRKLADWSRIVEYFYTLSKHSNRILVKELGKSTEGRPFIVAFISNPENLSRLEYYRKISCLISNPDRPIDQDEAERLVKEGRVVVAITNSIHATEVGGTQSSVELAYRLTSSNDPDILRILDNVIVILFPSFNPDGLDLVKEWYDKYIGTEYEGTPPPYLYHKYAGHDNNRDAYMLNLVESKLFAKVVYKEWCPQIYIDHHQMGSYGARLFLSPEMDPINPDVDPLNWWEVQFIGAYAASRLEAEGFSGVETHAPFTPDFISAFQTISYFMNIIGILTESASVKIATPIYIHKHQLRGYSRGRYSDRPFMHYPNPWPGGWWRLKDIVKQQVAVTIAILDVAARFREVFLRNAFLKATRSIRRGLETPPYAYVIPEDQHDKNAVYKLIEILLNLGIKVHKSLEPIKVGNISYPAGSFIVYLAQPRRALAKHLLERYFYPDYEATRDPQGKPIKPYDIATDTIADFLGVEVYEINDKFSVKSIEIESITRPLPLVERAKGYLIDPRINESYKLINILLNKNIAVYRIFEEVAVENHTIPPGSFYIEYSDQAYETLKEASMTTFVQPIHINKPLDVKNIKRVELKRIGLYQRFYGGNMEEGWTRFVLEEFSFSYTQIRDQPIKSGELDKYVDLLIFPDDPLSFITGENIEEELSKRFKRPFKLPPTPPEYKSGIGSDGLERLKEFLNKGGEILTMGQAAELFTKGLKLPLKDLTEDITDPNQFLCPGSLLNVEIDINHPLGFGMPRRAYVLLTDRPVLEIIPNHYNENYKVVAWYPEQNILRSGWLIGEKLLSRKPALIEATVGKGRAYIYAFRPIFRAQTRGTFKLFFNALYRYIEI